MRQYSLLFGRRGHIVTIKIREILVGIVKAEIAFTFINNSVLTVELRYGNGFSEGGCNSPNAYKSCVNGVICLDAFVYLPYKQAVAYGTTEHYNDIGENRLY